MGKQKKFGYNDLGSIIIGFIIIIFIISRVLLKKYIIVDFVDTEITHYWLMFFLTAASFVSLVFGFYTLYKIKTKLTNDASKIKLFFQFFYDFSINSLKNLSIYLFENSRLYCRVIVFFIKKVEKSTHFFSDSFVVNALLHNIVIFKTLSLFFLIYDIFNQKIYLSQYILVIGTFSILFTLFLHAANQAVLLLKKSYAKEILPKSLLIYEKVYKEFKKKMENEYIYINLLFKCCFLLGFFTIFLFIHNRLIF